MSPCAPERAAADGHGDQPAGPARDRRDGGSGQTDRIVIEVAAESAGERIDRYLAGALSRPRNRIQQLLRGGMVDVAGKPAKPSLRLEGGERIVVLDCGAAEREEQELSAEPGRLEILYVDEHLVVIDKPAGLVVHPGAGHPAGTLCNRLVAQFPELRHVGHPRRPGIVHRLDVGTSGVMVVARTEAAYQSLVRQFAARRVGKVYLALCYGRTPSHGVIERPIGRDPGRRTRMAVRAGARPARSEYRRLAVSELVPASALRVRLHTGRTHQIRVHLEAIGHPLLGDEQYGGRRHRGVRSPEARRVIVGLQRPALHAWALALRHPVGGRPLEYLAPLPADLVGAWSELGGGGLDDRGVIDQARQGMGLGIGGEGGDGGEPVSARGEG